MSNIIRSPIVAQHLELTSFPKPTLSLSIPIEPSLSSNPHSSFSDDTDSPVSSHVEDVHDHPPPTPFPWTWTCHRCTHTYRFSAALNRCLSCSHRFCRACVSEYDYDGWDTWSAFYHPSSHSTSASAFSPSTTVATSFYANPTPSTSNLSLDLCCDPTISEPCSSACTTPSLSPTGSSDSSSDEETSDDEEECVSPSEHAWFSQKSAEIERHFAPSVADDERLLMGYSWGMEMDMEMDDLSGCGDERPLRVLNHDEDSEETALWSTEERKEKPVVKLPAYTAVSAVDEKEESEDEEEDTGLWMSPAHSQTLPTTNISGLGVPKRSIVLPAWNPTTDSSDRAEEPSRLGYRTNQEADAVEGELKRILERIVEERGRYEEGMRSSRRIQGGMLRRV